MAGPGILGQETCQFNQPIERSQAARRPTIPRVMLTIEKRRPVTIGETFRLESLADLTTEGIRSEGKAPDCPMDSLVLAPCRGAAAPVKCVSGVGTCRTSRFRPPAGLHTTGWEGFRCPRRGPSSDNTSDQIPGFTGLTSWRVGPWASCASPSPRVRSCWRPTPCGTATS